MLLKAGTNVHTISHFYSQLVDSIFTSAETRTLRGMQPHKPQPPTANLVEFLDALLRNAVKHLNVRGLAVYTYTESGDIADPTVVALRGDSDSDVESVRIHGHDSQALWAKTSKHEGVIAFAELDRSAQSAWKQVAGDFVQILIKPFAARLELRGCVAALDRSGGLDQGDRRLFGDIVAVLVSGMLTEWERAQNLHLFDLSRSMTVEPPRFEATSHRICKAAANFSNCKCSTLCIIDKVRPDVLTLGASYGFDTTFADALRETPTDNSIAGAVALQGQARVIPDLYEEPGAANLAILRREGVTSAVVVPINGLEVRGSISIMSVRRRHFHSSTVVMLELLGAYAASLLDSLATNLHADDLISHFELVGHAFRSPLHGISLLAFELEEESKSFAHTQPSAERRMRGLIRGVEQEVTRANRRLESMLYVKDGVLDRLGLEFGHVAVGKVLDACVERYRRYAETKHSIKIILYDNARHLPSIDGDEDKIDLVIDNILENAVKYAWRGKPVEIRGSSNSREIRVAITDYGLGIPREYHDRLFEGYLRTPVPDRKRYIKGTGVGLRLAKMIVDAHGGRFEVSSEPFLNDPARVLAYDGYRTTFTLVLPRVRGRTVARKT
ncbi:MAG: GAF domain-containing sensor histidine kinase [Planctomycetota bacterium]